MTGVRVTERRAPGEAASSVLACPERLVGPYSAEADGAFSALVVCKELAWEAEADRGRSGKPRP
jgi:hypothetical protein